MNVVVLDVNVLYLSVVDWIMSEGNEALVVAFERDRIFGCAC